MRILGPAETEHAPPEDATSIGQNGQAQGQPKAPEVATVARYAGGGNGSCVRAWAAAEAVGLQSLAEVEAWMSPQNFDAGSWLLSRPKGGCAAISGESFMDTGAADWGSDPFVFSGAWLLSLLSLLLLLSLLSLPPPPRDMLQLSPVAAGCSEWLLVIDCILFCLCVCVFVWSGREIASCLSSFLQSEHNRIRIDTHIHTLLIERVYRKFAMCIRFPVQ